MLQKSIAIIAIGSLILTGCATTSKNPDIVRTNQQNQEQATYRVVHQDKVGNSELILRQFANKPEDYLTIVTRGKTATVSTVMTMAILATGGMYAGNTFSKEQLKGRVLEPKLKSTVLDHAKPAFANWLMTNHDSIAPKDKPITEVAVTAGRFSLIYPKLIGKESYQLNTQLLVRFKNNWDNRTAYSHFCDMKSEAKTLETWQANHYQAVDNAIKENIQACLKELDSKASDIKKHFSK
ncbi:hypothetical protein M2R47_00775 [Moraxella sp. Tifton1]|uniref:hypothetical protein n=1 Tax=Moraxella oculi TaxID=2940516 RepID=UPI0020131C9F|nr:hypothetical protein [Moraxella sp. Tifton1]MCL1622790.1 hypothetical protein [Moraxella sp. Tifton1]